jgi:flagellar motor switch protein FliN/FliY
MTDGETGRGIDALLHVPLLVTARLGSCRMTIADILKLGSGSVVELDRAAGEPVDLLANDRRIARGEIVAVGDRFGVRIVEIPEPRS